MTTSADSKPGAGFGAREAEFLASQALGRLAYLDRDGAPVVVPVSYRVVEGEEAGTAIAIVGHELRSSAKYRALERDPRCALVVDAGIGPSAAGLMVRGEARLVDGPGRPAIIIDVRRITTWGIESPAFERRHRRVESSPAES